ncbi:hypothetical protein O3P69_010219 [Scylla paramamosain]|uniref:Uncharacterized protein n=1 Tax=Scylla paramamosain TaxID=85552 RepID=A0AAW0TUM3_SCYPA
MESFHTLQTDEAEKKKSTGRVPEEQSKERKELTSTPSKQSLRGTIINFITPPVTSHEYLVSNGTRAHVNSAFREFSKSNVDIHLETFKEVGMRVSASVLEYSLFELDDVYLRILIKSLNKERALLSLLLDAPPDLLPLTKCHARVLDREDGHPSQRRDHVHRHLPSIL